MADEVLVSKAAVIERCVTRAREEDAKGPESFAADVTRQDALAFSAALLAREG